jgi:predicted PurR-regulated permease PerM
MLETLNKLPRQLTVGLFTFPLICLNGWLVLKIAKELQPLVSILITATLIAFLLDFPIRFLQERGVKRILSVGLVFLLFLVIVVTLGLFLIPLILRQTNELLIRLPDWIDSGQQQLQLFENWTLTQQLPFDLSLSNNLNQWIDKLSSELRSLTRQVVSLLFSAIGSIVNIILTLAFVIFLILRGERLWTGILSWFPEKWSNQIRQSLPQNFERFIVGQLTLATILGITQTIALLSLGVPLAQLFGLGIGVASLIPLGGFTTTVIVSLLLALQNFWLGFKFFFIALLIIQINDNVLAPRIVGELVGINPVWMLISLFIGVKLGGVLGLVIAVPIAGFIKGTVDILRSQKPKSESENSVTLITAEIIPTSEES